MSTIRFSYEHPAADDPLLSFRLHENGELAVQDIGGLEFDLLMDGKPEGEYRFFFTAYRLGFESQPSEEIVVNFTRPLPPTNLTFRWMTEGDSAA